MTPGRDRGRQPHQQRCPRRRRSSSRARTRGHRHRRRAGPADDRGGAPTGGTVTLHASPPAARAPTSTRAARTSPSRWRWACTARSSCARHRRQLRLRHAATQFDPTREYLLLLSEIDPDLHHAVETGGTYDFNALHNRYFTINGREFPDTIQDNGSALLPTQPYGALIRIQPNNASNPHAGAGPDDQRGRAEPPVPPARQPHHARSPRTAGCCSAPTGRPASTEHFGETIGSGQTQDYLLPWDDRTTGTRPPTRCRWRSRTTGTSPSRTPTPGTAATRTWATRARCRPARPRSEHLRRVVLPAPQPRAQRVRQLRPGLRRDGHAPARRPAGRLLRLPDGDEDHHRHAEERVGHQPRRRRRATTTRSTRPRPAPARRTGTRSSAGSRQDR